MKHLKKFGYGGVDYTNMADARGNTYTTSDNRHPTTNFACQDNPYTEQLYSAKYILDFGCGVGRNLSWIMENTNAHYVGLDPKADNHPLYDTQRNFYNKHTSFFEHDKSSEFHICPAEEFDFSKYNLFFDMVFTSPPYFNVEHYSQDDTQSFKRYKSVEMWNTEFLHKVLTNIYPAVKLNGIVAINISDVFSVSGKGKKRWLEITNPMNDHMKSLGMEYVGAIGMEMSKRPNSAGAGTVFEGSAPNEWTDDTMDRASNSIDKTFCEPIWLWRKV